MKISARSAVRSVHDAVRTQLWPLPVLGVVVAVMLGVFVPRLDALVDSQLPGWADSIVFNGDPGASRTVLDAVASSLITVTSLTFSLTVVTLQLASSQFSPRLLRTFTQDSFVQVTLAVFLSTFTYSLTVLRVVRSGDDGAAPFVPRLAVTLSFLLAVASVVCLVLFLAHLTRQIRVETMLRNVHQDATATVSTNLELRKDSNRSQRLVEPTPSDADTLWAWESGFLLGIDQDELRDAAHDAELTIRIHRHTGDFVVVGTPLGVTWSRRDRAVVDEADDADDARTRFAKKARSAIRLGPERTAAQDVGYGLRQLVDVTNKALSPGINDPTTAIHAIGHTAALLTELTDRHLGPLVLHDDDNAEVIRVIIDRPNFGHFLDLAIAQPRTYGKSDSQVLRRLYELLRDVAWHAHEEHVEPITTQLTRLRTTARGQDFDDVILAELEAADQQVRDVLADPRRA